MGIENEDDILEISDLLKNLLLPKNGQYLSLPSIN